MIVIDEKHSCGVWLMMHILMDVDGLHLPVLDG